MDQEQEKKEPQAVGQPQDDYTSLMVSYDSGNSGRELNLIKAYCTQYRGAVIELKESGMFCAAVCAVPKASAAEFKMKLQSHLEANRAKGSGADGSTDGANKASRDVKWI